MSATQGGKLLSNYKPSWSATVCVYPTSDGRKMDLRSYSQMVAVTTARKATNTGAIETTKDLGYDLFECTETATSCAVCAVMGRIYRYLGEDERFDALLLCTGV